MAGNATYATGCYEQIDELHFQRMCKIGGQGVVGSSTAERWLRDHIVAFPNALLMKASGETVSRMLVASADVVHIDAVHAYQDVTADFRNWEPLVRPGGCILFHDTVSFPDDVGRFFNELPGRKAEIRDCNGLGAWYKPSD